MPEAVWHDDAASRGRSPFHHMEPTPAPAPAPPPLTRVAGRRNAAGAVASGSVTRAARALPQRSRHCLARLMGGSFSRRAESSHCEKH